MSQQEDDLKIKINLNDFDQYGSSDSQSNSPKNKIKKVNQQRFQQQQQYQQQEQQDQIYDQQEDQEIPLPNYNQKIKNDFRQQGNSDQDSLQQGQIIQQQEQQLNQGQNIINQDIYDSSGQDSSERLRQEMKKKQEEYKRKQEQIKAHNVQRQLTKEEILEEAYEAAKVTNKKILILRRKNAKRIQQLQKNRMLQQNYLIPTNTHFRGNINQYPIITSDRRGRSYFHPNASLKVSQIQLLNFIKKNVAEEASANYLNEVVKFQNYAYQQRKKRKHNFQ